MIPTRSAEVARQVRPGTDRDNHTFAIPIACVSGASRSDQILAHTSPDDRALPGVVDDQWYEFLSPVAAWQPAPERLTVIAPHPIDEVLGAGGLIYTWAKRGLPITVVSVTDGEAASPEITELSAVRHGELRLALRALSAPAASIHRLGLPDGAVCEHEDVLYKDLLHYAPPGTTLVAPFERDGHTDHDAVGRVCRDIAASRGVALARYPVWLWTHAEPVTVAGLRWGTFGLSPQARAAKARAIQCFESQLRPSLRDPIAPLRALRCFSRSFEAFVL